MTYYEQHKEERKAYQREYGKMRRKLVRDAVNLLDAVDQAKHEDIDGYAGQIFEDASWIDRVDFLEADLHAIMKKYDIEIPE